MSRFVVGLTGGIGSGKSSVADLFVDRGVTLVDTDAIAHRLTQAGGAAMPALLAAFGPEIIDPNGAMDRAAMRRRVFADPAQRQKLEAILHPMIRQIASDECAAAPGDYVILAVPLLLESGAYRERCQRIVTVDCPEETQIRRVMARNGLTENEVRAILSTQASRAARLSIADDVIDNSGDLAMLRQQVDQLHQKFSKLFS